MGGCRVSDCQNNFAQAWSSSLHPLNTVNFSFSGSLSGELAWTSPNESSKLTQEAAIFIFRGPRLFLHNDKRKKLKRKPAKKLVASNAVKVNTEFSFYHIALYDKKRLRVRLQFKVPAKGGLWICINEVIVITFSNKKFHRSYVKGGEHSLIKQMWRTGKKSHGNAKSKNWILT